MKKILAITYNFWPDTSPTAFCLESVLKELSKDNSITIVTSTKDQDCREEYKGIEILRYFDRFAYINDFARKKKKEKSGIGKFYWVVLCFILSILSRLYYTLYPDGGLFWLRNAAKKVKSDLDLSEYNAIIASTGLYSTQVLAKKIKDYNPNVKWITYLNDPLPINNPFIVDTLHLFNTRKLSLDCIVNTDIIVANSYLYKKYTKDTFQQYDWKIQELDIPLLIEAVKSEEEKFKFKGDRKSIKLVYTGSLYKDIRSPEFMLDTLVRANENNVFTVHILGNLNDCEEIVSRYKKLAPNTIFAYGEINRKDAVEAIKSANILMNIGNNLSDQVPSKIFEYMGTGKPIIHFYSNDHDTSLKYLEKYGLFCPIIQNTERTQLNYKKVRNFILENSDKVVPYENIKKRLRKNTPQYAGEFFRHLIESMEAKND